MSHCWKTFPVKDLYGSAGECSRQVCSTSDGAVNNERSDPDGFGSLRDCVVRADIRVAAATRCGDAAVAQAERLLQFHVAPDKDMPVNVEREAFARLDQSRHSAPAFATTSSKFGAMFTRGVIACVSFTRTGRTVFSSVRKFLRTPSHRATVFLGGVGTQIDLEDPEAGF